MISKFKEFDTPTGVQNYFYSKNIKGKKIDLKDTSNVSILSKKHLSKLQANKIKKFAYKNYSK